MITAIIIASVFIAIVIGRDAHSPSDTDVQFNAIFEPQN